MKDAAYDAESRAVLLEFRAVGRYVREVRGMSQEELARRAGPSSNGAIGRAGLAWAGICTVLLIATELEVAPGLLLDGLRAPRTRRQRGELGL